MNISIVVRPASGSEFGRIQQFLKLTPSKHVKERDRQDIVASLQAGMVFIAQAYGAQPSDRPIVGVSVVYPRPDLSSDSEPVVFEAGTTLIAPNYRGAALHPIFHACRICQVFHAHFDAEVVTIIKADNKLSEDNAVKSGFVSLSSANNLHAKIYVGDEKKYFIFDKTKTASLAALLLGGDLEVTAKSLNGRSLRTFRIMVDSPLLGHSLSRRDLLVMSDV